MNQRGFATLEVILIIVVIGILATVAVPRFTDVTVKANTAKIQSDLTTIDTAIQIYYMEKGSYPADIDALVTGKYLMDKPKPPTGSAYINGESQTISGAYGLTTNKDRATCNSKTVDNFTLQKASSSSSTTPSGT